MGLRSFFQPPKFPDDQSKTFTARLLNFVLYIRMGNTLVFSLGLVFVDPGSNVILIANGSLIALLFVTRHIMHRGQVKRAVHLHLTSTLIGTILTIYFLGAGISTPTLEMIMIIIIVQAGLLLNIRYMLGYGVAGIASMIGIAILEVNGAIPDVNFSSSPFDILLPVLLLFVEIWSLLWIALGSIQSAQDIAQRELEERRNVEAEVRLLNEELEERVIQRTLALEKANNDLEAFAYSVSHDLRAPLRAIEGFTRILLEEYAPDMPAEAQRFQKLVRQNADKMGFLINELLSYSRLGRMAINKIRVSPITLVQQALEAFLPERQGRQIEISVGTLPSCLADPGLLYHVYLNLIGNAIKYTQPRQEATIEIGSDKLDGETVYFVKDNGVGFNMEYAHRVWGVFQRLHTEDQFEGSGIGLAIVEGIIHRHGGRVWVEAAEDKGAAFYFTVGDVEPDEV